MMIYTDQRKIQTKIITQRTPILLEIIQMNLIRVETPIHSQRTPIQPLNLVMEHR